MSDQPLQQQLAPSRWRKRPVEIEAMQWAGTMQSASAIYAWAREHGVRMGPVSDPVHETCIQIPTLEGDMRAAPDDWIIRGVQGEFYPCKPDIFAATYEAVTESNNSRPDEYADVSANDISHMHDEDRQHGLAPCGHPMTSHRDTGEGCGEYCHDCAVEKRDQRIACTTTKTCTCGHTQREHRERDNPPGPSWFSTCSKCACRSYTEREDGFGERGHRPPPPPPHKPPPNRYYP